MPNRWHNLKKIASFVPIPVVSAVVSQSWLAAMVISAAFVVVALFMIFAVIWLAKRTDAGVIETPILTWRRGRASSRRRSRGKGGRPARGQRNRGRS
jgi:hypothetical protein